MKTQTRSPKPQAIRTSTICNLQLNPSSLNFDGFVCQKKAVAQHHTSANAPKPQDASRHRKLQQGLLGDPQKARRLQMQKAKPPGVAHFRFAAGLVPTASWFRGSGCKGVGSWQSLWRVCSSSQSRSLLCIVTGMSPTSTHCHVYNILE